MLQRRHQIEIDGPVDKCLPISAGSDHFSNEDESASSSALKLTTAVVQQDSPEHAAG